VAAGRSVALILFKADDEEVLNISTEQEADEFLKREFPNTYKLMPRSEIVAFANRPPGKLPVFRYCGPELHYSNSVVLVGDVVHTVRVSAPNCVLPCDHGVDWTWKLCHKRPPIVSILCSE
jgi:hypothetical protein